MKIFPFFRHQEVFSLQCYAESLMTLFQVLSIVYAKIGLKVPQNFNSDVIIPILANKA